MTALAMGQSLLWLLGITFALIGVLLVREPVLALLRLSVRTGIGLFCLRLLSPLGIFFGGALGVNLLNALTLGTLGLPGLGLLFLLKWTLR